MAKKLKSTTRFADLPKATQRRVAKAIFKAYKMAGYGRGGYNPVAGADQLNRPRVSIEAGPETSLVPASDRNRMIALARNAARNSDRVEAVLHQLEVNIVGAEGGKAIFTFPEEYREAGEKVKEAFAEWATAAEYFDDLNLNRLLKLVLRSQLLGGDLALVFDWDVTSKSTGQVILFEADCIGNLEKTSFEKAFPGYSQLQGVVKDPEGKTVGVTVSWGERGQSEYERFRNGKLAAWTLIKPSGQKWNDSLFTMYRGLQRVNQARGASAIWPGLGTVLDLVDLQMYELQAAKKNSQTIATVEQPEVSSDADLSSELDPDAATPVEGAEDAAGEIDDREELELEHIKAAGCIYETLPSGLKMSLLDTKHPNQNVVEFARMLSNGVAYAKGITASIASGAPASSYSGAMAEFLIANKTFRDDAHDLEVGVLDWLFSNWSRMAQAQGIIPGDDKLPKNWRRVCVKWSTPPVHALNPVDEQNALNSGLRNGTILYRDKLGPDWREKIGQFAEEVEEFKKRGLVHPSQVTVAGAFIEKGEMK